MIMYEVYWYYCTYMLLCTYVHLKHFTIRNVHTTVVIEARNGMNSSVRIFPLNNLSLRQTVRLLAIRSHLSPPPSPALFPSVFSPAAKAKMSSSSSSSPSIPEYMKGVQIEKTGGTEVLQYREDLPVPVPKEGEVLVKIEFIGINFIDTYIQNTLSLPI